MFSLFTHLPQRYYHFWLGFTNLKNKTAILPIDFNKHWMRIIWSQKSYLISAFISETFTQIFYTLVPLFIGWAIEQRQFIYFVYLIGGWLLAIIGEYITAYFATLLEIQCINSIQYYAYQFFLTVDPIYHTTRSSGKLFAKIERGARSYEDFLDIILYDLSPTAISVITVIVSFIVVDIKLGALTFILLLIIGAFNITFNLFIGKAFEQNLINADDEVKALSVESLTQVQLIRASFASSEIASSVKYTTKQRMFKEGAAWLASSTLNLITRIIYLASIFILGYYIISALSYNFMTTTVAITLIITYIRGTYEVIKIGRKLRKLIKSVTRIDDLYSFIKTFGKQTFPVLTHTHYSLDKELERKQTNSIVLDVQDLYFDYNPKATIFENHKLYLEVPKAQENKLYGIIGPSGMGKTTLLSILGGQLKPTKGSVSLNGISIYTIDDRLRREIIAIQGQVASSLSGTLRSTLLIGLPITIKLYSDTDIITVLKEVGIWSIFEEKEGLDTVIGEGGLTLSGGQRQRLNFASLYLRARYYKPLLLLIDEPTSSLDQVSEKAITGMISKLAHDSLTLVIAHRIKTLEAAVRILDFSLLDSEKEIKFYTTDQLEQKSLYYKKLIEGDINIES